MYEVTLGTAGIMQLGWATGGCQFSNEEGVGDSVDSYAYDGKRVQRWNISCKHCRSAELLGILWPATSFYTITLLRHQRNSDEAAFVRSTNATVSDGLFSLIVQACLTGKSGQGATS